MATSIERKSFNELIPLETKWQPKNVIWNVVSAILIPIGLYRATCYAISKWSFSSYVLGSSSKIVREDNNHRDLVAQFQVQSSDTMHVSKIKIPTGSKLTLDAVRITLLPQTDYELVFALPSKAIWQQVYPYLVYLAKQTGRNLICVNYRATGGSSNVRSSRYQDLFRDVESGMRSLKDGSPNKTAMVAPSLGGTVALALGNKYNLEKVAVLNTMARIPLLAKIFSPPLLKTIQRFLENSVKSQQELPTYNRAKRIEAVRRLSISQRFRYSAEDLLFSLPHMILRITYFALSLLVHAFKKEWKQVKRDAYEIGRTLLIDTALIFTGFASLIISPCSNKLNQLNGKWKSTYLKQSHDGTLKNSAVYLFAKSDLFIWIAQRILISAGWDVDNTKAAKKLHDRNALFASQVPDPYDITIPHEASLHKGIKEQVPVYAFHDYDFTQHPNGEDLHELYPDEKLIEFLETPEVKAWRERNPAEAAAKTTQLKAEFEAANRQLQALVEEIKAKKLQARSKSKA